MLTPTLVESFRTNGLKVVDVVMGIEHGAAVTGIYHLIDIR